MLTMTKQHMLMFRVVIGVLAMVALLVQIVVVPQIGSSYADSYPEVACLEGRYVLALVAAIAAFEVALLAALKLLSTENGGVVLISRSNGWINLMTASLCSMSLLLAGVCAHAAFVENIGGPGAFLGFLIALGLAAGVLFIRDKASDLLAGDGGYRLS